jgi:glycosyltransferase involved in cell wall biosynthesis
LAEKKHIALITTWFPPQHGVAANRMTAFAEYLGPDYELEIFCLGEERGPVNWNGLANVHYSPGSRLLDLLKSSRRDGRLKHNLKTLLRVVVGKFVRNPLNGWRLKTVEKLVDRHRVRPFDVVISSFSPQEAHLAALDFCKAFPDVRWIADMRDEMSFNPHHSAAANQRLRQIEHEINRYASAVTSVSAPILEEYKKLLPDVPVAEEIRNGFNHNLEFEDAPASEGPFRFGYFGSFYGEIKPDHFFRALLLLEKDYPFEVHIYGGFANFVIPPDLKERVVMHPELPYLDAIKEMRRMDANVVIHPTSKRKGVYTGKLFDYISVRKPVLALMDEQDVAAGLVRSLDCGYVCDNADVTGIRDAIVAAFNDKDSGALKTASPDAIAALHRSNGVRKLKTIIEQITS